MQVDQEDQKAPSGDTEEKRSEAEEMEVELFDKSETISIKTPSLNMDIKMVDRLLDGQHSSMN